MADTFLPKKKKKVLAKPLGVGRGRQRGWEGGRERGYHCPVVFVSGILLKPVFLFLSRIILRFLSIL